VMAIVLPVFHGVCSRKMLPTWCKSRVTQGTEILRGLLGREAVCSLLDISDDGKGVEVNRSCDADVSVGSGVSSVSEVTAC